MKIGIPKNYFGDGLDEDVKIPVLEAAKTLEKLGATLEEFEMPVVDYAIPTYYVVACAEASSNLSRYDGIKYGYRSLMVITFLMFSIIQEVKALVWK